MDAYDDAIAHLTANPEEILDAWGDPEDIKGGCLFDTTGPRFCHGCLTQVKLSHEDGSQQWRFGGPSSMLPELLSDDRIPSDQADIQPHHLPAFAEWQRRLDQALGRQSPRWNPAYEGYER